MPITKRSGPRYGSKNSGPRIGQLSMLIDERETAKALGVTVACLRRWRWAGTHLPFIKLGNRLVRYRMEDVQAFIDSNLRNSTSDQGGVA